MKIAGRNHIFPPLSIIMAANKKRKFIIYYLFVFANLSLEEAGHLYLPAFGISSIN